MRDICLLEELVFNGEEGVKLFIMISSLIVK